MTTRLLVPVALVTLAAGPLAAVSPEAAAAGDGYHGYVACSTKASAKPTHQCKLSQTKAAFFVSSGHDATYKVCVKFPGRRQRLCASAQPAPKGKKRFVTIATANTGKHVVKWYVDNRLVESWTFQVTAG